MKWRKGSLLLLIGVLIVSLTGACSSVTKGSASVSSSGGSNQSVGKPGALPKIYIYQNTGVLNKRPQGSDPAALQKVTSYIEKQTGVDPVTILAPQSNATDKLNVMLSSGSKVDVFQGAWDQYKDTIIPINDLLDKYGPAIKKAWPKAAWASMTDKDGKIWGIPRFTPTVPYPLWVRQDWLKKLNLPMPQNISDLEKVMEAFKTQDPDGDGKPDTIPLVTDTGSVARAFVGGFTKYGYSNWYDPTDKTVKIAELQPGYVNFLKTMADWYQKGYLYKGGFGKYDAMSLLKTGRVGMWAGWYSRITLYTPKIMNDIPQMDYEVDNGITGPDGKLQTVDPASTTGYLISKSAKHPEDVIKFINWQYEHPANFMTAQFGLEGTGWKWIDESKHTYEILDKNYSYAGEYCLSLGLPMETSVRTNDPTMKKHQDYLQGPITDLSTAKLPMDYNIVYNTDELKKQVPNYTDIDRLRSEEMVKFIMGERPISQFPQFIQELKQAGLDQYQAFLTKTYLSQKK